MLLRNTRTNRGVGSVVDPGRTRPLRGPIQPRARTQTPNFSNRLDPPPPGTGRTSLETRYPFPLRAAGSDHGRLRPQRLLRPRASASLRQSHTSALARGLRLGYGLTSGPQDSDQARRGVAERSPSFKLCQEIIAFWRGEGLTGFGRWMKAGTGGSAGVHPDGQGWPSPQMAVAPSPF